MPGQSSAAGAVLEGGNKNGHLYGLAFYGTASAGASRILKYRKTIMDQFPGAS